MWAKITPPKKQNTWWQFVLSAKKTKPALSSCVLERAKEIPSPALSSPSVESASLLPNHSPCQGTLDFTHDYHEIIITHNYNHKHKFDWFHLDGHIYNLWSIWAQIKTQSISIAFALCLHSNIILNRKGRCCEEGWGRRRRPGFAFILKWYFWTKDFILVLSSSLNNISETGNVGLLLWVLMDSVCALYIGKKGSCGWREHTLLCLCSTLTPTAHLNQSIFQRKQ